MTGILCAGFLFIGCCLLLTASLNVVVNIVAAVVGLISVFLLLVELLRYYKVHPLFHFRFTALPTQTQELEELLSDEPAAPADSEETL